MSPRGRGRLAALLLLTVAACSAPPSHFTRLWPKDATGEPLIGLSTEEGVVMVRTDGFAVGDLLEIQFPVGNSLVRDWGRVDRLNESLMVVQPLTARLQRGRLAQSFPKPEEQLYLALRDDEDEPLMQPVEHWRDGAYGDWIVMQGHDPLDIALRYQGTGVYVQRSGRWEIVGLLAGLTAYEGPEPQGELALGFIGLEELARILPQRTNYFEYDIKPLRPDFEFGVPLQPGDIDLPTSEPPAPPTPPPR
jgi:hypothetical protein